MGPDDRSRWPVTTSRWRGSTAGGRCEHSTSTGPIATGPPGGAEVSDVLAHRRPDSPACRLGLVDVAEEVDPGTVLAEIVEDGARRSLQVAGDHVSMERLDRRR